MDSIQEYFCWEKSKHVYKIIFMIAVCLFIYSQVLNKIYGDERAKIDPLNVHYVQTDDEKHSGWTISHFLMYFVLGLAAPYCMRGVLTIGLLFEVFESALGMYTRCAHPEKDFIHNRDYGRSWWKGTTKDIVVNTLGFIFGAIVSILILKER
jgi:hypothetical protein